MSVVSFGRYLVPIGRLGRENGSGAGSLVQGIGYELSSFHSALCSVLSLVRKKARTELTDKHGLSVDPSAFSSVEDFPAIPL